MLLVLQWEGLFGAPVHATRAMAASDLIAAGFNMATKFELPCQGLGGTLPQKSLRWHETAEPGRLSVAEKYPPALVCCPQADACEEEGAMVYVGTYPSAVPAGKRLEAGLALAYEKVRQNGSMGVKELEYVAQTFDVKHETVRRIARKYHQEAMLEPSFSLTFPQFSTIMRESLGLSGGGEDGVDLLRMATLLTRKYTVFDATCTTPNRIRSAARVPAMPKRDAVDSAREPPKTGSSSVLHTPLDTGLATPRRLKTANFLPTSLNLTLSAKKRTGEYAGLGSRGSSQSQHFRPHDTSCAVPRIDIIRGASAERGPGTDNHWFGDNVSALPDSGVWRSIYSDLGSFYGTGVSIDKAGQFRPSSSFPPHTKFESEAQELGRFARKIQSEDNQPDEGSRHPQTGSTLLLPTESIDAVIFRTRQTIVDRGWTRFDVTAPFLHYDSHGAGIISVSHFRAAFAELGERVSDHVARQLLMATGALLEDADARIWREEKGQETDFVYYNRLVDALISEDKQYLEISVHPDGMARHHEHEADSSLEKNGKGGAWPDDLVKVLGMLHSKVASRPIPTAPFIAGIIANDVAFTGKVSDEVFARVMKTEAGLVKDHADVLTREFACGPKRINYRDLIQALENYPAERARRNLIFPGDRKYIKDKHNKKHADTEGAKDLLNPDPSIRNKAALEAVFLKINRKIANAGDLRVAFEKFDVSRRGRITYDDFVKALLQFGISLGETEADTLLRSMDPDGQKSVEYGHFISMVFPIGMLKKKKGSPMPLGFKASLRVTSSLSPADQMRHLRMCVEKALAKGSSECSRMLGIFRLPGDRDVDALSLKQMLMDFGLSLTNAQTSALIQYIDPTSKSAISFYKLVRSLLPPDCILQHKNIKSGLNPGASMIENRSNGKLPYVSDCDFHHACLERIKRHLSRKGPDGVSAGKQLRELLGHLLCQSDVTLPDMKRAFVGVGIFIEDSELLRLMNLYRSPAHPKLNLSKLIEDIDDRAFDFVFSSGNVAGGKPGTRMQREMPARADEPDDAIRKKLRRVLKRRMEQDGAGAPKNVVTMLRMHDIQRTGKLSKKEFQAALFSMGLKVESNLNMDRIWSALASGVGVDNQTPALDILDLASSIV